MRNLNLTPLGSILLSFSLLIALNGCGEEGKKQDDTAISAKHLMDVHCTSCHLLPNPENLDKTTWKSQILPRMGYMLGFRNQADTALVAFDDSARGREISEKTSPYLTVKTPQLSLENWQKLQDYIIGLAPVKLPRKESKITAYTNLFEVQKVEMPFVRPATTLTTFIAPGHLIAADANKGGTLMHFDDRMRLYKSDSVGSNMVHIDRHDGYYWLTHMGTSFIATDEPKGHISRYSENSGLEKVVENLTRPVHVAYGDLSGNGDTEFVVSEFGKWTGRLSWWKKKDDKYEGQALINLPGAIKSEIVDMNQDGKNDIAVLFGQGDEAIYMLYNTGNGEFTNEKVLQFPPTYGSSYFEMLDYNQDGFLDIMHTAGDNGDYEPIAKPYHGIRIFLNDGQNQFKEKIFIPLYGVYKAIAEDFDQDGDIDFAAISYFPKYNKEYFVYRENLGNGWFMPKLVKALDEGRWLTMDCFDHDGDGDKDLVLGWYDWEQNMINDGPVLPLVYLKNTTVN